MKTSTKDLVIDYVMIMLGAPIISVDKNMVTECYYRAINKSKNRKIEDVREITLELAEKRMGR